MLISATVFFNTIQLIWGIILTLWYIPQIKKMIVSKDVSSFSISSLSLVAFGIFLMELYAIYLFWTTGNGLAFLITNTLSLSCAIIVLVLCLKYKAS